MKDNRAMFAGVIRKTRNMLNLTLRDAEEKTGISFSQLAKIERGEVIPDREKVELLASVLKLDVNYLLVCAGYVPTEMSLGTAQLINDLWGTEESNTNIAEEDIILFRNNMANFTLEASIPDRVPIEFSGDLDEDWSRFIKDMKKKKISTVELREYIIIVTNMKKMISQLEKIENDKD